MKRLLTLTMALLLALTLVSVSITSARAEEDPYVGLWQITGQQDGDTYTAYADMGVTAYLDFMPNGAIYAVMTDGEDQMADYMAYKVTGENTLDIYEGDDPLPSVYDPATGVISVTDPDGGLVSYVERVTADPLPDIRALVDNSQEEQTYYGYKMTQGDQTIDMLQMLPAMGLDPRDFYLELEPDGTGYLQFGDEETSSEITWTETEMTADGESVDLEIHCPNGRKEGAPRPQEKPVTGKIRKNYGFTYESCGTCKGCQYDLSKRTHICNRRGGERIGQNQYAYVCDGWTDSRY